MASSTPPAVEATKKSTISTLKSWGASPLPPITLATLTTALHAKPFQPLPMLFPPILLFSTYLNLSGFAIDSAGLTAAWSGLYLLLASRRKTSILGVKTINGKGLGGMFARLSSGKFGARGLTRGAAMGVAGLNLVGGGVAYAFGDRAKEARENGRELKVV